MADRAKRRAYGIDRPNLSAKLERLRIGLKSDTIAIKYKEPTYKELKSATTGPLFDPLRQRSKLFRKAITTYAPPYHFWHKDYMHSLALKPIIKADETAGQMDYEEEIEDEISCLWCGRSIAKTEYDYHRLKKCKKRHEFCGNGYYPCVSCKESFLYEDEVRYHVSKHFPNLKFVDTKGDVIQHLNDKPKSFDIICRDQAKRKKWL